MLSDDDDDEDDAMAAVEKYMDKSKKNIHDNTGCKLLLFNTHNVMFTVSFDENLSKRKRAESEDEDFDEGNSKFTQEMDWEEEDEETSANQRATKREPTKTILGEDLKPKAKKQRLTPEELAMGEQLIYSSKAAKELEEWGWNKYFFSVKLKYLFLGTQTTMKDYLIGLWKMRKNISSRHPPLQRFR